MRIAVLWRHFIWLPKMSKRASEFLLARVRNEQELRKRTHLMKTLNVETVVFVRLCISSVLYWWVRFLCSFSCRKFGLGLLVTKWWIEVWKKYGIYFIQIFQRRRRRRRRRIFIVEYSSVTNVSTLSWFMKKKKRRRREKKKKWEQKERQDISGYIILFCMAK